MKAINLGIICVAVALNGAFLVYHFDLLTPRESGPPRKELRALIAAGDEERALAMAYAHYQAMDQAHGTRDERTVDAARRLGMVYRRMDLTDKAQVLYEGMLEEFAGERNAPFELQGALLTDLIRLYMQIDREDEAIATAQQKLALREAALGPGSMMLVGDLLTLADLYRQTKDYDAAKTALLRSKEILDGDPQPNMRLRNHIRFSMMSLEHLQESGE